jgi:subtilisin family serine protease
VSDDTRGMQVMLEDLTDAPRRELAHNDSYVVGRFTFKEVMCALLPLSSWARDLSSRLYRQRDPAAAVIAWADDEAHPLYAELVARKEELIESMRRPPGSEPSGGALPPSLVWLARIAGLIGRAHRGDAVPADLWRENSRIERREEAEATADAFLTLLRGCVPIDVDAPALWLVNCNRTAHLSAWRSRETIKIDAAERTLNLDYTGLRWAIIDCGIDATHPAFQRRGPDGRPPAGAAPSASCSRIIETYDFTRLRRLADARPGDAMYEALSDAQKKTLEDMQPHLLNGRSVSWELLRPVLRVPHADSAYVMPPGEHGTHVAGILAADWPDCQECDAPANRLRGMCPTLELYDLRVFDEQMNCDEFAVIAALQFVRYLNGHADQPIVHGVNISISMLADVTNYACGRTPVCEECDRLVNSGVVTIVAAGNLGYEDLLRSQGGALVQQSLYQAMCITDPGNAESVITVGATHRQHPHTYGVSYFSSRGPTGDGRHKPDLVAPGEKIEGPVPGGGYKALDGTSMAAPHVSGAAVALMARHGELIGDPREIKRILVATATDLGRDRAFQGAGLLDVFRALQSV